MNFDPQSVKLERCAFFALAISLVILMLAACGGARSTTIETQPAHPQKKLKFYEFYSPM